MGNATTRTEFEGTPDLEVPLAGWASGLGLKRIAREQPFDLVHAQHYGGATRAYFACRRYGWPMVYEIHSLLGDEVARDSVGTRSDFQCIWTWRNCVFRHAAAVIALGEPVKQVVIAEKGVSADRVSVIYPGIDLAEYDAPGLEPAAIPGICSEHKVVMYVGSIVHPNQGVPLLIEALPEVFEAVPEARCVLVGGPAEAGETYHAPARPLRRSAHRPHGTHASPGGRTDTPRRRAGPLEVGVPRELLGAKQNRRVSRRRPSDRGH